MRIVHIANFYGPSSGGIKTTLHALGSGYQKYGHEFIYIVPGTQFNDEITQFGRKISMPSVILPGSGSYRVMRSNAAVKMLLLELAPDRLEISDRFTLRSLGNWAKAHGIPTVVFSHETLRGLVKRFMPFGIGQRTLVNWHNRALAKKFDHVIATTDFAAQEFREIGVRNLVKVPLGVDLHNFSPENRSEALRRDLLKGNKLLIVHCGRLSPEKEPQRSIDTLIELRKRGIDARLVIIGMGPMWKSMRELASGHPIDLLGYIANPRQVAAILASADATLAPGPLETFCLSALESIASGTPVVASASSAVGEFLALRDVVPAGAVARDDEVSFADAVTEVLLNKKMRSAARSAAEALPWEATILAMMRLHQIETLGEKAPSATTRRRLKAA